MEISIVTPCRNSAGLIGDTVASITNQSILDDPTVSMQYIVVDGASTDETLAEIETTWVEHPRATIQVISEPDRGMYDALGKGLSYARGDVVAYLNAGDYYSPHCLSIVRTCFDELNVAWLTGMRVTYSADGALISAKVPFKYDGRLLRGGYYGVRGCGRFLQQESTFWRRHLFDEEQLSLLRDLNLAGDLFLWTQLARKVELEIVAAHLGGFRFHGNHLSDALASYKAEAKRFLTRPMVSGYIRAPAHEVLSWIPPPLRRRLPGRHPVIAWDRTTQLWSRQ